MEYIPIFCHLALFQLLTSSLCSHGSVWPTWAKRNSLRPTLTHCFSHWNLWEEGTQHLHPRPGHGLGLNQFSSLVAIGDVGCQGMIQSVGPAFQMYYMAGQEKLSKGEDNEERAADYSHSRRNLAKNVTDERGGNTTAGDPHIQRNCKWKRTSETMCPTPSFYKSRDEGPESDPRTNTCQDKSHRKEESLRRPFSRCHQNQKEAV